MLLYYITDSSHFPGKPNERRGRLLDSIAEAARCGLDFIQLREKQLTARELEELAMEAVASVRASGSKTKLLINSRVDVAIASGADGVHLRSKEDLSASEARAIFHKAGVITPTIAVSCHALQEVYSAEAHGADFAVFGPVLGKLMADSGEEIAGVGWAGLNAACHREAAASSRMPVLALGGIMLDNAATCIENGASGIAAIRLFQPDKLGDFRNTVNALRELSLPTAQNPVRRHPYQS